MRYPLHPIVLKRKTKITLDQRFAQFEYDSGSIRNENLRGKFSRGKITKRNARQRIPAHARLGVYVVPDNRGMIRTYPAQVSTARGGRRTRFLGSSRGKFSRPLEVNSQNSTVIRAAINAGRALNRYPLVSQGGGRAKLLGQRFYSNNQSGLSSRQGLVSRGRGRLSYTW